MSEMPDIYRLICSQEVYATIWRGDVTPTYQYIHCIVYFLAKKEWLKKEKKTYPEKQAKEIETVAIDTLVGEYKILLKSFLLEGGSF